MATKHVYRVRFEELIEGADDYIMDSRNVLAGPDAQEAVNKVKKRVLKGGGCVERFRLMSVEPVAKID